MTVRPDIEPAEQGGDRTAGCQLMAAFLLVFWLCVFALVKRYYIGG